MADHARVVETAMALRGEAPESWEKFVMATREYAALQTTEMMRCPPELLQRAQGMALQATDFAALLVRAPELYEKMQNTILGRSHGKATRTDAY